MLKKTLKTKEFLLQIYVQRPNGQVLANVAIGGVYPLQKPLRELLVQSDPTISPYVLDWADFYFTRESQRLIIRDSDTMGKAIISRLLFALDQKVTNLQEENSFVFDFPSFLAVLASRSQKHFVDKSVFNAFEGYTIHFLLREGADNDHDPRSLLDIEENYDDNSYKNG